MPVGFFLFKQKTAYEMRISDWSSDVCSSDLRRHVPGLRNEEGAFFVGEYECVLRRQLVGPTHRVVIDVARGGLRSKPFAHVAFRATRPPGQLFRTHRSGAVQCLVQAQRSEEHTSELQSLMRISYAVFCLKKKTLIDYK